MGGHQNPKGLEVADTDRGLHGLSPSMKIHRPAKQVFALEEDDESEDMFRYNGSTSVDWPGWIRFCSVTVVAANICSGLEDGLRDATDFFACRMDNTRPSLYLLLQYSDLLPVPGSTLTGHMDAVEHEIDKGK